MIVLKYIFPEVKISFCLMLEDNTENAAQSYVLLFFYLFSKTLLLSRFFFKINSLKLNRYIELKCIFRGPQNH